MPASEPWLMQAIAAGAIGSAQLLMLSGIGPAEHLESLGIPLVRDLPGVGANLQDHPRAAVTYASKLPLGLDAAAAERARDEYHRNRSGPLSGNGVGAGALVRLAAEDPAPGVKVFLTASPTDDTFSLHVALLRPMSRGEVRLQANDPGLAPLIRLELLRAFGEMSRQTGIGVVIVEQQVDEALAYAGRAIVLDHGVVVHGASAAELASDTETLERWVGMAVH